MTAAVRPYPVLAPIKCPESDRLATRLTASRAHIDLPITDRLDRVSALDCRDQFEPNGFPEPQGHASEPLKKDLRGTKPVTTISNKRSTRQAHVDCPFNSRSTCAAWG